MRTMTTLFATALAVGIAGASAYAQEATFKAEIAKADEASGTITLKRNQTGTVGAGGATEDYKVRDGLLFNAVQAGDKVRVTVESVNGRMTITKLEKE
jgi:Cu(I)/Ag(I) efflux system protein CusF